MKLASYLLFFSLLLNLISPVKLFAPTAPTGVTATVTDNLSEADIAALGTNDVLARRASAGTAATRALNKMDVVTADDFKALAPTLFAAKAKELADKQNALTAKQAELTAEQAKLAKAAAEAAKQTAQIEELNDDVSDANQQTFDNSMAIGLAGMGGLALAGGGGALAYHKYRNKPTTKNALRKIAGAEKIARKMAKDPNLNRKLPRVVEAIGEAQEQVIERGLDASKELTTRERNEFIRAVMRRTTATHARMSEELRGAEGALADQYPRRLEDREEMDYPDSSTSADFDDDEDSHRVVRRRATPRRVAEKRRPEPITDGTVAELRAERKALKEKRLKKERKTLKSSKSV